MSLSRLRWSLQQLLQALGAEDDGMSRDLGYGHPLKPKPVPAPILIETDDEDSSASDDEEPKPVAALPTPATPALPATPTTPAKKGKGKKGETFPLPPPDPALKPVPSPSATPAPSLAPSGDSKTAEEILRETKAERIRREQLLEGEERVKKIRAELETERAALKEARKEFNAAREDEQKEQKKAREELAKEMKKVKEMQAALERQARDATDDAVLKKEIITKLEEMKSAINLVVEKEVLVEGAIRGAKEKEEKEAEALVEKEKAIADAEEKLRKEADALAKAKPTPAEDAAAAAATPAAAGSAAAGAASATATSTTGTTTPATLPAAVPGSPLEPRKFLGKLFKVADSQDVDTVADLVDKVGRLWLAVRILRQLGDDAVRQKESRGFTLKKYTHFPSITKISVDTDAVRFTLAASYVRIADPDDDDTAIGARLAAPEMGDKSLSSIKVKIVTPEKAGGIEYNLSAAGTASSSITDFNSPVWKDSFTVAEDALDLKLPIKQASLAGVYVTKKHADGVERVLSMELTGPKISNVVLTLKLPNWELPVDGSWFADEKLAFRELLKLADSDLSQVSWDVARKQVLRVARSGLPLTNVSAFGVTVVNTDQLQLTTSTTLGMVLALEIMRRTAQSVDDMHTEGFTFADLYRMLNPGAK